MKVTRYTSFLILILLYSSCSQLLKKNKIPKASDSQAVLHFGYAAYLKGCVDAHHSLGVKKIFFECSEKAKHYIKEMEPIVKE